MRLYKLTCLNCSGTLDMEIAEGVSSVFCPYCGQRIFVNNKKKEYTINKNININKSNYKRYTNDAEILKVKLKEKEDKRLWIVLVVWFAVVIVCIGILLGICVKSEIDENFAKKEGKVSAGYYQDLIGEDYKTVEAHFEAAGFTNIELIDVGDSGIAFWKNGKVTVISVGGDTDFESTDWFDPNTKVIISYH